MENDQVRAQALGLVQSYQKLLGQQRWDEWIELWADNGVLEFPFAPDGRQNTYVGKAAIKNYMAGTEGKVAVESVASLNAHPMLDPNMVAAELTINGRAVKTGGPYNQRYVLFFEIENGKLKRYREYWNPLISVDAFGGRDAWTASFGSPKEN